MAENLCIIPTGKIRWIRLLSGMQDAPQKLQAEYRDYDGTRLVWRDVECVSVSHAEFFSMKRNG